ILSNTKALPNRSSNSNKNSINSLCALVYFLPYNRDVGSRLLPARGWRRTPTLSLILTDITPCYTKTRHNPTIPDTFHRLAPPSPSSYKLQLPYPTPRIVTKWHQMARIGDLIRNW